MKKSAFFLLSSAFTLSSILFLSSLKVEASSVKYLDTKTPGAILIGVPPGCDCTAPANTCYCVTKDLQKFY